MPSEGRREGASEFRLGDWQVYPDLNEAVYGEQRVHLEPRVMDLLVYLASRAGELVTKEELNREVWDEAFVGDDALVSAVSALRRALGDSPRRARLIETVPKRGYRLVAPVARGTVSVAVLPFENISPDRDEEFFADGMTDALIAALGRSRRDLRVISRTSSMRYKDSSLSLPEIAASLNVDVVVEGSVQRQDDLVRITTQLIDGRSDQHLWAEVYERDLGDVLALQGEIANHVDQRIRAALQSGEAVEVPPPSQVDAVSFVEYLRGRFELYRLTPECFDRALAHFERAREADPDSPFPYLGIADVWGWRSQWGQVPPQEAFPLLEEATTRAVELDDTLPRAHTTLGKYAYYCERDWEKAESAFRRALGIDPNDAYASWSYSLLLASLGRLAEGESHARDAVDRDPQNPVAHAALAWQALRAEKTELAVARARRACELEPAVPPVHLVLWSALAARGEPDGALAEASSYFSLLGRSDLAVILRAEQARGYSAAMGQAARALARPRRSGYVQPTQIARLFAQAGEGECALEWLELAYREGDGFLVHLAMPEWSSLRALLGFRELMRRLGLPP